MTDYNINDFLSDTTDYVDMSLNQRDILVHLSYFYFVIWV